MSDKVEHQLPELHTISELEHDDDWIDLNGFKGTEENPWKPGDIIIGTYLYWQEIEHAGKKMPQYFFLTEQGVIGCNGVKSLESLQDVPPGTRLKVTYIGEGDKSMQGNRIKQFRIQTDRKTFKFFEERWMQALLSGITLAKLPPAKTVEVDYDPFADTQTEN